MSKQAERAAREEARDLRASLAAAEAESVAFAAEIIAQRKGRLAAEAEVLRLRAADALTLADLADKARIAREAEARAADLEKAERGMHDYWKGIATTAEARADALAADLAESRRANEQWVADLARESEALRQAEGEAGVLRVALQAWDDLLVEEERKGNTAVGMLLVRQNQTRAALALPAGRGVADALAAADALVGALPRCHCGAVATWSEPGTPDMETGKRDDDETTCDEHCHHEGCGRPGCCDAAELPYAAHVRAFTRVRGGRS